MRALWPITLRITDLCEDRRCTPLSLLRFVAVEICCHGCPFSEAVLEGMQSFPRLRGLDLSFYRHGYGLKPLYELSNLAGVSSLKLGMQLTEVQVEHMAGRLPLLRTLHLLHAQYFPAMTALRRLPHLTCLAIAYLQHSALIADNLSHLAACAKLTYLILIEPHSQAVLCVLQHPILCARLAHLELREFDAQLFSGDGFEGFSRGFAAMQLLRFLTLRSCIESGAAIVVASHAPALETITVLPRNDQILTAGAMRHNYTVPCISDVRDALKTRETSTASTLCLELRFTPLCRELNTRRLGALRWEIEMENWRALQTKTARNRCRFRLVLDAPQSN